MNPIDPEQLTEARSRINEFVFGDLAPGQTPADRPRLTPQGGLLPGEAQARLELLTAYTPQKVIDFCQQQDLMLQDVVARSAADDREEFACEWFAPEVVEAYRVGGNNGSIRLSLSP